VFYVDKKDVKNALVFYHKNQKNEYFPHVNAYCSFLRQEQHL